MYKEQEIGIKVDKHEEDSSSTTHTPNQPVSTDPGVLDLIGNMQAQIQVLVSVGYAYLMRNTGTACIQHSSYGTSTYNQCVPS